MLVCALLGCGPKAAPAPMPVAPAPAAPAEPDISLVTSVVVFDACPDSKHIDTKQATREIDELVVPCKKVPGGAAHFSATLMPGGEVELGSPSGDRAEGIVPTCLLQQRKQLRHKLRLKAACKFDVKLEQRGNQP